MSTLIGLGPVNREFLNEFLSKRQDVPLTEAEFEEAKGYDFTKVTAKLDGLRPAVERAIEADRAEATSFWTELGEVVQKGVLYLPGYLIFRQRTEALVNETLDELGVVEALVHEDLAEYAPVPHRLDNDADQWLENSRRAEATAKECANQSDIPGWVGDSKVEYDKAVAVQEKAMTELSGIMQSAAQGCSTGALLNRAVFLVVSTAITYATESIRGAHGRGAERFGRTATALTELQYLAEKIRTAITGDVTQGSARNLSTELRRTLRMPNLLTPGSWPTGNDAAGIDPADTAGGVTSDGRDANSRVRVGLKDHHEGVDRG